MHRGPVPSEYRAFRRVIAGAVVVVVLAIAGGAAFSGGPQRILQTGLRIWRAVRGLLF